MARIERRAGNHVNNIMIADADRNIIYMNRAVVEMLTTARTDIRRRCHISTLPKSRADRWMASTAIRASGQSAGQPHRVHRAQISLGGRTFTLVANPIIDDKGNRLGSVVEWTDRTAETAVEKEVAGSSRQRQRAILASASTCKTRKDFSSSWGEHEPVAGNSEVGLSDVRRMLVALARRQPERADRGGVFRPVR